MKSTIVRRCVADAPYVIAVFLLLAGTVQAFDSIKTNKGTLSGKIVGMDATKVDLQQGPGGALFLPVPANAIQVIFYEAEPRELKAAKQLVLDGHYRDALAAMEEFKEKLPRDEMQQDVDFYKASCTAKLALGGSMKAEDARRLMNAFAENSPKSYHHYEAIEAIGDLLAAEGKYAQAAEYYGKLDGAPWPDYKMRAGVAAGRALLAQGKPQESLDAFEKVLSNDADSDLAQAQRTAATLGKARALVGLKKTAVAIAMIEDILKKGDAADAPLMARAYNILGTAQRQAGRPQEAVLAFLHVDVLYPSVQDAHAEALANLAELWAQLHKPDRAIRARQTLEEQYRDSPWAKKREGGR